MGERTVLTGYGKGFLLSDILEVTKDYLLKGVEPVKAERAITQKTEKVNANIFTMIETVFNLMDLLMTWIAWYERQTAFSLVIAVVLLLWSFVVFGVGMTFAEEKTNVRAKAYFL